MSSNHRLISLQADMYAGYYPTEVNTVGTQTPVMILVPLQVNILDVLTALALFFLFSVWCLLSNNE